MKVQVKDPLAYLIPVLAGVGLSASFGLLGKPKRARGPGLYHSLGFLLNNCFRFPWKAIDKRNPK